MSGAHDKAVIDEPSVFLRRQQAYLPQKLQMPRQLVLRLEQAIDQLAEANLLARGREHPKNANTGWVGKSLKDEFRLNAYNMHSCIIAQLSGTSSAR